MEQRLHDTSSPEALGTEARKFPLSYYLSL
jgi:hypothetical protein